MGPAPPRAPGGPPTPSAYPHPTPFVSPVIYDPSPAPQQQQQQYAEGTSAPEARPPAVAVTSALAELRVGPAGPAALADLGAGAADRASDQYEQGRIPSNDSHGAVPTPDPLVAGLDANPAAVYPVPGAPDAPVVVNVPNTVVPPAPPADTDPARYAGSALHNAAATPEVQVGGGGRLAWWPAPATPAAPQLDVQPRPQEPPAPSPSPPRVPHLAGAAVVPNVAGGADHALVGGVKEDGQFDDADNDVPPRKFARRSS